MPPVNAVAEYVRRTCAEQGVPEFVRDDAVIDRAIAIVRPAVERRLAERRSA